MRVFWKTGKFPYLYTQSTRLIDQIALGKARNLVHKFDVKKRVYYGNTSMDAEMSLLMANQTLVSYQTELSSVTLH